MLSLTVNGESRSLDVDPKMPLLRGLRDLHGLTGTKYGCGSAECGAIACKRFERLPLRLTA